MMISVWIGGEVCYVDSKNIKKLIKKYGKYIKNDKLSWTLAYLINKGYVVYLNDKGEDRTDEALKAIDNTLKILGINWRDVKQIAEG